MHVDASCNPVMASMADRKNLKEPMVQMVAIDLQLYLSD